MPTLAQDQVKRGKIGSKRIKAGLALLETGEAIAFPTFTVAALPSAVTYAGRIVSVSNGAAGSPCLAFSNGTNWLRILLGAAVAIS